MHSEMVLGMPQESSHLAEEQTALQSEVQQLRQRLLDLQHAAEVCLHAGGP